MNKYVFLIILFVLFSTPSVVSASDIQSGNSSAQSSVETRIEGNGNVQTHIETSANGVKKVLDATGPGTYKVDVQSGYNSNSKIPTPAVSTSSSSISSTAPAVVQRENNKQNSSTAINIINNFRKYIEDFLRRIFNSFKLDKSF